MLQGIGDIICTSGAIADIRKAWPEAFLVAVVRGVSETTLLRGTTRTDDIVVWDPGTQRNPMALGRLLQGIRRFKPDVFFVPQGVDRFKAPLLAVASGARIRVGESSSLLSRLYTHPVARVEREHKVDTHRRMVRALGLKATHDPTFEISAAEHEEAVCQLKVLREAYPRGIVALHPGSGEEESHKRWPEAHFAALVRSMDQAGIGSVLLGGPEERGVCNRIAGLAGTCPLVLAGQLSLPQTAAVAKACDVTVGADSGVMHLAAAAGAHTICLFGPTDENVTAPYRAETILVGKMECRPCYDRMPLGCGDPICMKSIESQAVSDAILRVKERSGGAPPDINVPPRLGS